MSYYNDPSFQEGYALAQKKNRTPQNRRLQELIEIGRKQDYNKARAQAGPTPEEKASKINEFLNLYKPSSNRYDNTDKPIKRNTRYGAQEERYDFD